MSLLFILFIMVVLSLFERRSKSFIRYAEVSITKEKNVSTPKLASVSQHCWVKERNR